MKTSCSGCQMKGKRTTGGYLCQVFVGVNNAKRSCPPSVMRLAGNA